MQPKGVISTIGYQGSRFVAFRSTLQEAGIVTLIDVRAVPWSRNPQFTKQALTGGLAAARIAYIHLGALGNPHEGREASADGDREAFEAIYRRHLEGEEARAALAEAAYIAGREPTCLMCMERDPHSCHRSLTAMAVAKMCGFEVRHLWVPEDPRQGSLFGI